MHIRDEIVDKPTTGRLINQYISEIERDVPCRRDREKPEAITAEDEHVRDFGPFHGVLFETVRLLHVQTPDKHGQCWDDAKSERPPPDGAEVVRSEAVGMQLISGLRVMDSRCLHPIQDQWGE
jgi:hypothetical protein